MKDFTSVSTRIRETVDKYAVTSGWPAAVAALRPSRLRAREVIRDRRLTGATVRPARVSVVIPCYNYAHFLTGAVASALDQRGVEVQVIIVNDESTDRTAAVADELAARDPRVTAIHNEQNLGHVSTFNRGLERADGEFLVRLDADDLLTPGCLARAVALFDHDDSIGLVYGTPHHFTTPDPPAPRVANLSWTIWDGTHWLGERCRRGVNCITTPEAMVRMSVVNTVGPLDTRLKFAQDMEMWCRIAAVSAVGRIRGADQAFHRDHAVSMSVTDGAPAIVDLRERRQVFASTFESTGRTVPHAEKLHRVANRTLAREAVLYAERALESGDTVSANAFLEFARETSPGVLEVGWRATVARRSSGHVRLSPAGLARRRLAGLVRELDYVRWAVHGV